MSDKAELRKTARGFVVGDPATEGLLQPGQSEFERQHVLLAKTFAASIMRNNALVKITLLLLLIFAATGLITLVFMLRYPSR